MHRSPPIVSHSSSLRSRKRPLPPCPPHSSPLSCGYLSLPSSSSLAPLRPPSLLSRSLETLPLSISLPLIFCSPLAHLAFTLSPFPLHPIAFAPLLCSVLISPKSRARSRCCFLSSISFLLFSPSTLHTTVSSCSSNSRNGSHSIEVQLQLAIAGLHLTSTWGFEKARHKFCVV